jgi:hypothetical protein
MNSNGTVSSESVNINGSHALVTVRTLGDQTYWTQPIYSGQMPARVALLPQKVETPDSNESTPINKKESSNKRTQRNKLKKKVKK